MSVSHERLLLLKNATVNWNLGFDNVCKEKSVIVAHNNEPNMFEVSKRTGPMEFEMPDVKGVLHTLDVSKGEMVRYPVYPALMYWPLAWEWEIHEAFFKTNNIKPIWLNCNYTWGTLNYTTGQWSGAVGMIQRDEADYAIFDFGFTYERSKVAAFSPGVDYAPRYWFTRYPLERPPTWNLLGLFTKGYISRMNETLILNLSNLN